MAGAASLHDGGQIEDGERDHSAHIGRDHGRRSLAREHREAISAAFLAALLSGHWADAEGFTRHASSVAGLIAGGLLAAPFAGYVVRVAPVHVLTYAVGLVVLLLAGYQTARLSGIL